MGCYNITALASDGTIVFAGTADCGVYVSNTTGTSWTAINNGLTTANITSVQYVNGYLVIGTKTSGIFVSTDNGINWSIASNGLPVNSNIRCLCVNGTDIFAGTGNGEIFLSNDYGNNWMSVSDGLMGSPVLSLCVYSNNLYAGINAGGVWTRPLSEITEIKNKNKTVFINVYPNPTNGELHINNVSDFSSLEIINVLGKVICKYTPDNYQTLNEIDLTKVTKGIYFVKVYNGEKVHIEKVVIN
jgi:ligand-binding sensor domain-containing protein